MILAVDTETTGLNWFHGDRPYLISYTREEMVTDYIQGFVNPFTRAVTWNAVDLINFQQLLDSCTIIIFHNASFDIHMLETIGIKINKPYIDTLVFTHLVNNSYMEYGLKPLTKKLLGMPTQDQKDLSDSTKEARRKGKKLGYKLAEDVEADYWLADPELVVEYACQDTERTMNLYKYLEICCKKRDNVWELLEIEMACTEALISMERVGISIDLQKAKDLEQYYETLIAISEHKKAKLGFASLNTNSPKQMMDVFYNKLGAKVHYAQRKRDGVRIKTPSMDKHVLAKLAPTYELADVIVKMNSYKNELNTFIKPLQVLCDERGVVHPSYRQVGATTGRLSCTNPNLQNISNVSEDKKARELFVPRAGCILYFPDYSQIEVWIAAFTSGDEVMKNYLLNGHDLHGELNNQFFGGKPDFNENKGMYRKKIKGLTFATIYGAGANQLSEMGLGLSVDEGKDFISKFYTKYSGLDNYKKNLIYAADQLGFIEDNFGRRYYIDEGFAFKSLNYMIQGSASGVMKRAIINVHNYCKKIKGANLLLTIHDELCIEMPMNEHCIDTMKDIVECMQGNFHTYFNMPKPFDVSMAVTETNWAEKKEVAL